MTVTVTDTNTERMPGCLGIIGAMQVEVAELVSHMTDTRSRTVSGITFTEGLLRGRHTVVAGCGIGKVFAALCAQTMILLYHPDAVINTGVAGSLSPRLGIGQVAVAEAVVQHDMDTTPIGDPKGLISGLNIIEIPTDPAVTDGLCACVRDAGVPFLRGVIASGDTFVAGSPAKERIRSDFPSLNLVACEMEGAAIGQVCFVNRTPCAILRAISDGGDEQAYADYPSFLHAAAHTAAALLEEYAARSHGSAD